MKYGWRRGNTTYFEDRRFEGTVMNDDRMKPNFVKVKIAEWLFLIWRYAHRCLVNVVLAPSEAYLIQHDFRRFSPFHF